MKCGGGRVEAGKSIESHRVPSLCSRRSESPTIPFLELTQCYCVFTTWQSLGGDTWALGCRIPDSVVFPEFNAVNPDMADPK